MQQTVQIGNVITPRASQIARIIQKRRPLAHKIETVETNLKTLSAALRQMERQRDQLLAKIDDFGTVGRLKEFDCSSIQRSIDAELAALDNRRNCESLAATIAEKHITVQDVIIANCAAPEETRVEILNRVLNYLTQRIEVMDRQYASACQERLIQLLRAVKSELGKAKDAWKQASRDDCYPKFVVLSQKLQSNLKNELEGLLSSMIVDRDTDDQNFKTAVDAAIELCRAEPGIPSLEEIKRHRHDRGALASA